MTPELGQNLTLIASVGIPVVGFGIIVLSMNSTIKKDVEKKVKNLQSKEMCEVLSGHIKDTVDEIKGDVKKLLGKNGIK